MSHDSSPYRPPPQSRWPQATPPVPWPSYSDGDVYRGGAVYRDEARLDGQQDRYGRRDNEYASYPYGGITDSFDGARNYAYPEPALEYPAPVPAYRPPAPPVPEYLAPEYSALAPPALAPPAPAPAAPAVEQDRRRPAARPGRVIGAWTGLLAVEVTIGVSTLAAAFVRPQAAPVIAAGDVFLDHVPAGLRNVATAHFGSHGRIALLLVMYLAIACLALGLGLLSRRATALGVTGLAVFTLLGAFVTITRAGGRATDVIPAVIGGVAGTAALLLLQRLSTPRRAGTRQRPPMSSLHTAG